MPCQLQPCGCHRSLLGEAGTAPSTELQVRGIYSASHRNQGGVVYLLGKTQAKCTCCSLVQPPRLSADLHGTHTCSPQHNIPCLCRIPLHRLCRRNGHMEQTCTAITSIQMLNFPNWIPPCPLCADSSRDLSRLQRHTRSLHSSCHVRGSQLDDAHSCTLSDLSLLLFFFLLPSP